MIKNIRNFSWVLSAQELKCIVPHILFTGDYKKGKHSFDNCAWGLSQVVLGIDKKIHLEISWILLTIQTSPTEMLVWSLWPVHPQATPDISFIVLISTMRI